MVLALIATFIIFATLLGSTPYLLIVFVQNPELLGSVATTLGTVLAIETFISLFLWMIFFRLCDHFDRQNGM